MALFFLKMSYQEREYPIDYKFFIYLDFFIKNIILCTQFSYQVLLQTLYQRYLNQNFLALKKIKEKNITK